MPLTISHPAAVVPLARLGLVLSALVVGSMSPDFPYFIPLSPSRNFSHSIMGVFIYCIPVGLAALGIFHFLLKKPALALLPLGHQQRLVAVAGGFSFLPWRRFLLITFSLFCGALTHILWDSFTHSKGWMVQQFVILKAPLISIGSQSVPIYQFLQHASTLVGGILLIHWYIQWHKSAQTHTIPENWAVSPSKKVVLLASMGMVAFSTAVISGIISIPTVQTSLYLRYLVGHIFIVSFSIFIFELVLFSIYWHLRQKRAGTM